MIELSAALVANLIMAILSAAMLIQSVRLMRSFRQLRTSGLSEVIGAIDRATTEATAVLNELRTTLAEDINANRQLVAKAAELRDELEMMSEMGNATAERILGAVEASRLNALADLARSERVQSGQPKSFFNPRKP